MTDKNIHYVWLMGGLGNQLFQINTGKFLANKGYKIKYTTNLIEKNFFTQSILGWNIHDNLIQNIICNLDLCNYANNIPPILAKSKIFPKFSYYYSSVVNFNNLPSHIFGYFQDISFNQNLWFGDDIIYPPHNFHAKSERVIHLRFTDANNFNENIKFYKSVINEIKTQDFIVCTDDINYSKKFLDDQNVKNFRISTGSPLDDFYLLSNAKELVIAPSSFSWWAGKLNKSLDKYWISSSTASEFGLPKSVDECAMAYIE